VNELHIPQELIDGCLRRAPEAQEGVYRICYASFMKTCLRYTGNYDDAANVLQDAFLKIFTRIDAFSGKGNFAGWMKRIVINTAIDHVRKEKQQGHVPLAHVPEIAESDAVSERFVVDEKKLLEVIQELPKMQLLVFNLFVMDDCSHQEIAERLSITVATSKWYLFDARKILQKKLAVYVNG
jgi:RNA polymerase sigma-70 factor, ECF subfamily